MDDDSLRLAELMCTRLCHDLSGPIGGAAAGVELLEDEAGGLPPEVTGLLGASVTAASRHLTFLRAAFGRGGPTPDPAALESLARGFVTADGGGPGVRLDWRDDAADSPAWGKEHGKLALNLVLAGRDALAFGGTLAVTIRRAAPWRIVAAAQGRLGAAAEDLLRGMACEEATELSPRGAQTCYARRLATALGGILYARHTESGLVLTAEERKRSA